VIPESDHTSQSPPPGERLTFEISSGNGYVMLTLQDGAILAVHPIVMDVAKTNRVNERGEPVYSVMGGLAVRLMKRADDAPDEDLK
jgi:hypothetical protein